MQSIAWEVRLVILFMDGWRYIIANLIWLSLLELIQVANGHLYELQKTDK